MEQPNSGEMKGQHGGGVTSGDGTQGAKGRTLASRNTLLRVLSGLPAVGLIVALILFAPPLIIALTVAIAGVYGAFEYFRMLARTPELRIPGAPLLISSALVGLGALTGTSEALHGALLLGVLLLILVGMVRSRDPTKGGFHRTALSLAGLLLIPWLINHVSLLLRLPDARMWVLFMVAVVIANDTFAFTVGTLWGRHPLVPAISPNKTVEGALGGLLGGLLVGTLGFVWASGTSSSPPLYWMLAMSVVLAAAGQAGDLLESWIKRRAGVKESGIFLPGHGGLLDRIDAFLLSAPICYYMVLFYSIFDGRLW